MLTISNGGIMTINLTVNKKNISVDIDPTKRLIDFLRDNLGLTGVKEGCSEGEWSLYYNNEW